MPKTPRFPKGFIFYYNFQDSRWIVSLRDEKIPVPSFATVQRTADFVREGSGLGIAYIKAICAENDLRRKQYVIRS
jgi:hypothetical protein